MNPPWEFIKPLDSVNLPNRRCPRPRAEASHRILILRLASFGDILMGTPLVSAMRDQWPEAHITWVVEREFQDAIIANPDIDEILLWEGKAWKKTLRQGNFLKWAWHGKRFMKALRRENNIFISFQPEEWPLVTRAVNAKTRIGIFDTFRKFNNDKPTSPRVSLYTDAFSWADLPPHRTDQYLLALRALGLPEQTDKQLTMGYTKEDRLAVDAFFGAGEPPIIFVPLTTWPSRCWPQDRWVKLGDALEHETSAPIILIGSAKERAGLEAIAEQMHKRPIVASGTLSFREIAALLSRAQLIVTGDTGPMHVAAAVGAPTVALFGPTARENLAPLAGKVLPLAHPVTCGPCDQKICANVGEDHLRCLTLITVEEALVASRRLLSERVSAQ